MLKRFYVSSSYVAVVGLITMAAFTAVQTVTAAATLSPTPQQVAYGRAECLNDGGTFIGANVKSTSDRAKSQLIVRCGWPHSPKVVEQDISSIDALTALPTNEPVRVFTLERSTVTATHP